MEETNVVVEVSVKVNGETLLAMLKAYCEENGVEVVRIWQQDGSVKYDFQMRRCQ